MKHERLAVSCSEAGYMIGVSGATIRRWCLEGKIKHTRMPNGPSKRITYLIHLDELKKMLTPYEKPQEIKLHTPKRRVGRPESIVL